MNDQRIASVVEQLRPCTGGCPNSINQHVHFPGGGWGAFLNAVSAAVSEPLPPPPAPADPFDALMVRWRLAFAVVWGEMGPNGDIAKAAEIALAMAR